MTRIRGYVPDARLCRALYKNILAARIHIPSDSDPVPVSIDMDRKFDYGQVRDMTPGQLS